MDPEAKSELLLTGPIAFRGLGRATRDFFRPDKTTKHRAAGEAPARPGEDPSEPVESVEGGSTQTPQVLEPASPPDADEPASERESTNDVGEENDRVPTAQIPLSWMFTGAPTAPSGKSELLSAGAAGATQRPGPPAYPAALDAAGLERLRRRTLDREDPQGPSTSEQAPTVSAASPEGSEDDIDDERQDQNAEQPAGETLTAASPDSDGDGPTPNAVQVPPTDGDELDERLHGSALRVRERPEVEPGWSDQRQGGDRSASSAAADSASAGGSADAISDDPAGPDRRLEGAEADEGIHADVAVEPPDGLSSFPTDAWAGGGEDDAQSGGQAADREGAETDAIGLPGEPVESDGEFDDDPQQAVVLDDPAAPGSVEEETGDLAKAEEGSDGQSESAAEMPPAIRDEPPAPADERTTITLDALPDGDERTGAGDNPDGGNAGLSGRHGESEDTESEAGDDVASTPDFDADLADERDQVMAESGDEMASNPDMLLDQRDVQGALAADEGPSHVGKSLGEGAPEPALSVREHEDSPETGQDGVAEGEAGLGAAPETYAELGSEADDDADEFVDPEADSRAHGDVGSEAGSLASEEPDQELAVDPQPLLTEEPGPSVEPPPPDVTAEPVDSEPGDDGPHATEALAASTIGESSESDSAQSQSPIAGELDSNAELPHTSEPGGAEGAPADDSEQHGYLGPDGAATDEPGPEPWAAPVGEAPADIEMVVPSSSIHLGRAAPTERFEQPSEPSAAAANTGDGETIGFEVESEADRRVAPGEGPEQPTFEPQQDAEPTHPVAASSDLAGAGTHDPQSAKVSESESDLVGSGSSDLTGQPSPSHPAEVAPPIRLPPAEVHESGPEASREPRVVPPQGPENERFDQSGSDQNADASDAPREAAIAQPEVRRGAGPSEGSAAPIAPEGGEPLKPEPSAQRASEQHELAAAREQVREEILPADPRAGTEKPDAADGAASADRSSGRAQVAFTAIAAALSAVALKAATGAGSSPPDSEPAPSPEITPAESSPEDEAAANVAAEEIPSSARPVPSVGAGPTVGASAPAQLPRPEPGPTAQPAAAAVAAASEADAAKKGPSQRLRPTRPSRPPGAPRGGGGGRPWSYVLLAALAVACIALVIAVYVKTRHDEEVAAKEAAAYTPPPLTTPSETTTSALPVISVVGDQLTSGTSADSGTGSEWPALLATARKADVKAYAAPGLGYVVKGSGGATVASEVSRVDPRSAVVVLFAGTNDESGDTLSLASAATRAISAAHARAPKARIVVVGPVSRLAHPSSASASVRDTLRTAASIGKATFEDPISEDWLSGSSSLTDPSGRLTDAGERAMESKMVGALKGLV